MPNPDDKSSFFVVNTLGPKLNIYVLARQVRDSYKYKKWRKKVFAIKGKTCEICGCNHHLNIHHRGRLIDLLREWKIQRLFEALNDKRLWETKRGQVLCSDCHSKKHPELNFDKYFASKVLEQTKIQNAELILG